MDSFFFIVFAVLVLAGGIFTVALRNAVHCALGLLVSLVGTAGLFLLAKAEFLFAAQIILYAGGVLVLFLFVIMLVNLDTAETERRFSANWPVALACTAAVAAELGWFVTHSGGLSLAAPGPSPLPSGMENGNTEALGNMLLTQYLVPFEIASVLLLAAVVGGVLMAGRRRGEPA